MKDPAERPDTPPLAEITFCEIMGSFPTGVAIITGRDEHGAAVGLTANSVTSVSKSPPLVLVCIGEQAYTLKAIRQSQSFAVNFLEAGQEEVARRFAYPTRGKFAGIESYTGILGVPILQASLAYAECRVSDIIAGGDHALVVGAVVNGACSRSPPLLYFRGRFYPGQYLER
ncbi:MAG: flavin reductase family protein [Acetobacteraceae bacterium]